jgi:RNA polymerase sigma factor (sigma-70 family)
LAEVFSLFLQEREHLLAYVKRIAPQCDALDVVQELGLRLLAHPEVEADRERVKAWCKTVARHIVLHELRSARYERAKIAALDLHSTTDAWEPESRAATRSTIAGTLERMDPVSREIVLRRYVLEQTSNEIAREVKLSAAAVRMRLMRIRGDAPHDVGGSNGVLPIKPSGK